MFSMTRSASALSGTFSASISFHVGQVLAMAHQPFVVRLVVAGVG
jgi:hypothetical protein